jgi:hypothetical protein
MLRTDPLVSFVMNLNLAGLETLLAGVFVFGPHLPPNQIPLLAAEILVVSVSPVVLRNDQAWFVLRPLAINLPQCRKKMARGLGHRLIYFLAIWLKAKNLCAMARPLKWIKTKLAKPSKWHKLPPTCLLVAKPKRKVAVIWVLGCYRPV